MTTTRKSLNFAALAGAFALLTGGSSLFAAPIFYVAGGGIAITGQNTATAGNTVGTAWTVSETMTSAGTLGISDTDGAPLAPGPVFGGFTSGTWITKTVLNNTGETWTSFEMELQQILGTASGDGDGLSFAQGAGLVFTSNVFSTITRQDITRDYLNFSGGSVASGASVSFTFAVTDNSPQTPVFLLQTPNRSDRVPDSGSTAVLLLLGVAGLVGFRRKLG
jgi:hypothetical protein